MRVRPLTLGSAAASVLALTGALLGSAPARAGSAPVAAQQALTKQALTKQAVATGTGGAVASADVDASKAGIAVLKNGGNAIDAAVAVASTLGVTEPFVAGPGGGGFMVIYLAKQHRVVTIDGRETCPRTCTPSYFLDPATGKPLDFETARRSGISVGVPGMVATWAKAVDAYGARSFGTDLQPAIRTARRGFTVDATFRQQELSALPDLQSFSSSRSLFLTKGGNPLPLGSTLRNPDLARTYELLAQHGAGYLYGGPLGAELAHTAQHPPMARGVAPVRGGTMSADDVRDYVAKTREPTHVTYRGLDVYGMAPPSSGGSTVGEALNILSGWDLSRESRARALFHYLEASRLAFADRNAYVGDADYVPVPLSGLLDPAYAATRRCVVDGHALSSPVAPGSPFAPYPGCSSSPSAANQAHEGTQTNHLTTADRWGNVVSYTNTIEQLAGSGITLPGRGFLLNNELTDFDFAPATPATYDPNLAAPGKRPRSSMSPTIVLKDGAPYFAVGSPGGSTIITTVLQILLNRIDFGMTLPQAIAAPRVSQRNTPASVAEPAFYDSALRRTLETRYGESFTEQTGAVLPLGSYIGNATGISFLSGHGFTAAAEPVRLGGGSALVVDPR